MLTFRSKGLQALLLAIAIFCSFSVLQAQDKPASPGTLKIGFLMDSLKVERWQTDLDKFQKRATELRAQVLVETAEGDDELQLQQAQKLLAAGVKALVLVPHDADKAVRIVNAAKAQKVPLLCYERLVRDPNVSFFIGVDASAVGYLQAFSLSQMAPKGNYVLIGGSPTDTNAKLLHEAQMKVLQPLVDRGDIKIVSDTWSKDWDPSEAYAPRKGISPRLLLRMTARRAARFRPWTNRNLPGKSWSPARTPIWRPSFAFLWVPRP
jgi:D-xylose transport system substrate-binding protein